jgi:hypothetical protein
MLSAIPVADVTYALKAAVPRGAKWLTLFGGFPDRTAAWHKSDVTIDVSKDSGKPFGKHTFPNRSGMSGATFQLPKGVRSVTLNIRTRAPENRRFCFDALFSGII